MTTAAQPARKATRRPRHPWTVARIYFGDPDSRRETWRILAPMLELFVGFAIIVLFGLCASDLAHGADHIMGATNRAEIIERLLYGATVLALFVFLVRLFSRMYRNRFIIAPALPPRWEGVLGAQRRPAWTTEKTAGARRAALDIEIALGPDPFTRRVIALSTPGTSLTALAGKGPELWAQFADATFDDVSDTRVATIRRGAARAVAAHHLGGVVTRVSTPILDSEPGQTCATWSADDPDRDWGRAVTIAAGLVAHDASFGSDEELGPAAFYASIDRVLYTGVRPAGYEGSLEREALAEAARSRAAEVLDRHAGVVSELTQKLTAQRSVSGLELRDLLGERD